MAESVLMSAPNPLGGGLRMVVSHLGTTTTIGLEGEWDLAVRDATRAAVGKELARSFPAPEPCNASLRSARSPGASHSQSPCDLLTEHAVQLRQLAEGLVAPATLTWRAGDVVEGKSCSAPGPARELIRLTRRWGRRSLQVALGRVSTSTAPASSGLARYLPNRCCIQVWASYGTTKDPSKVVLFSPCSECRSKARNEWIPSYGSAPRNLPFR